MALPPVILDSNSRLSSSPASSPRVVEGSIGRKQSIHPEMERSIQTSMSPGANFFDDSSDDELPMDLHQMSQDAHATANSSGERRAEGKDLGHATIYHHDDIPSTPSLTSLNTSPIQARHMSIHRPGPSRLVTTTTPRNSGSYTESASRSPTSPSALALPYSLDLSLPFTNEQDPILSAHAITMRALETRHSNEAGSGEKRPATGRTMSLQHQQYTPSRDTPQRPARSRSRSPTHNRNIDIASLTYTFSPHAPLPPPRSKHSRPTHLHSRTRSQSAPAHEMAKKSRNMKLQIQPPGPPPNHERPKDLPAHFIRTPYPFSPHKTFPKPRGVQRSASHPTPLSADRVRVRGHKHSFREHSSNTKKSSRGGLGSNSRSDATAASGDSGGKQGESVLYLSLTKRAGKMANKTAEIAIPASLTLQVVQRGRDKGLWVGGKRVGEGVKSPRAAEREFETLDFDDEVLATQLREGYRKMVGPWWRRWGSARGLGTVEVGVWSGWSGGISTYAGGESGLRGGSRAGAGRLLAARDTSNTFSEAKLWELYWSPKTGKARYAWVHWARRVAASKTPISSSYSAQPLQNLAENGEKELPPSPAPEMDANLMTGIVFTHRWRWKRILFAIALVLALSVLATLLWTFFGSTWVNVGYKGAGDRVATGCLMGVLILLLGLVVLGAWCWVSWM
ncbi:hypothetical protein BU16DRAFT_617952 [Lophium mytilinum]|uniref:Uncharacterized protein n=1 Tax=Lophium mytilinum TaxID=390894 RepID=A0A6A6QTM9_9PEZI|nr:hypothetical protein BU16DRAFT_617952 [Lophium mytilinum]